MHRRLVSLRLRRPLAGLLICALLLTQALGLLHRVLHADGVGFGFVEPGAPPPLQAPAPALQAPRMAAQAAGYLARGPPRTG